MSGDFAHAAGGFNIFGQVEIINACRQRRLGHQRIVMKTERRQDRISVLHCPFQRLAVGRINGQRGDARSSGDALQRRHVDIAHHNVVIVRINQQPRNHAADFSGTQE